jgi:hypothetical protein
VLPRRYVLRVDNRDLVNHRLLVSVWRRLVERHGADTVPVLISPGDRLMVDDLLADLAASGYYLGGKIEHMPDLSDEDLGEAYRWLVHRLSELLQVGDCRSRKAGPRQVCVASNRTSIPEAGGDLIDYFDPSNDDDALAKIERLLFEPGYLAAREARLRAEYRPRTWADCVHALISKLDRPVLAAKE